MNKPLRSIKSFAFKSILIIEYECIFMDVIMIVFLDFAINIFEVEQHLNRSFTENFHRVAERCRLK